MPRPNIGRSIASEKNLARRIAIEREGRGLSYEALAKAMTSAGCKINASSLYKIEKGKPPRKVTVDELVAFAEVFGIGIENLLTPVELLNKERVHEILKALGTAEMAWFEKTAEIVQGYIEYLRLAAGDEELFEYAAHLRFSDSGVYAETLQTETSEDGGSGIFEVEGIDFDASELDAHLMEFYSHMLDISERVVSAELEASRNGE